MNALKTIIFTVLVPGTVAVLIPYRLALSPTARGSLPLGSFRYLGVLFFVAGAMIYLRCAWDFVFAGKGTPAPIDPPKELVARGLYNYVRNPMYVGVLSVVLGQAFWFEALTLFLYAGLCFLLFNVLVLLYEEPALTRKFGEAYWRYCEAVPRWIPRPGRRQRALTRSQHKNDVDKGDDEPRKRKTEVI
jgi:protein-S-isoprenylcysteine O-methyltransferase Ste14